MKDNKLIAEFMGAKPIVLGNSTEYEMYGIIECINDGVDEKHFFIDDEMEFHTSWGWLMPVVEKIECTTIDNNDNSDNFFNVMIEVFECNINGGNICICESGNNKREATYKAVVEFIKQYNKES
tara:strand:+ start:2972 stop:3343 length:372 start_codon:yes stop_codon:yes gene_type:complete